MQGLRDREASSGEHVCGIEMQLGAWPRLGSGVGQEDFLQEAKSEWGPDSSLELLGGEEGGVFPEGTACG